MVARALITVAALFVMASCSEDATWIGPGGDSFTEGLTFDLVVNGSWSSDPDDTLEITQGQIRVTAATKSQVWLGSDAMSHIGDTPEDERYQTTVRFGDLAPGRVTVRVVFQHYDSNTDKQVVTTLIEVSTVGDDPIEIKAGKITDIGTVEVTVPQS